MDFINGLLEIDLEIYFFRLDFDVFVINGPSTATDSATKALNGVPTTATAPVMSTMGLILKTIYLVNLFISTIFCAGQCITDTFLVLNSGGIKPPVICGTNSGQHSMETFSTISIFD